jgi:hypothetical protein
METMGGEEGFLADRQCAVLYTGPCTKEEGKIREFLLLKGGVRLKWHLNLAFGYPRGTVRCGWAANSPRAKPRGSCSAAPSSRTKTLRSAALNGDRVWIENSQTKSFLSADLTGLIICLVPEVPGPVSSH